MNSERELLFSLFPIWLFLVGLVLYIDKKGWIPERDVVYGFSLRGLLIFGTICMYPLVYLLVFYLDKKEEAS